MVLSLTNLVFFFVCTGESFTGGSKGAGVFASSEAGVTGGPGKALGSVTEACLNLDT